ncbi:hypothetical protein L798_04663 [Zootermopsis nevadensis]|uniref:Uncharacterized protein n=1 Tax=Zootermopsis nevadensis TaxID=136037 RepID=A0A067RCY9_ZOONE|nr:hypothetical protein L798_04663 [Zootermopsis nevadensis]
MHNKWSLVQTRQLCLRMFLQMAGRSSRALYGVSQRRPYIVFGLDKPAYDRYCTPQLQLRRVARDLIAVGNITKKNFCELSCLTRIWKVDCFRSRGRLSLFFSTLIDLQF